jgi:hypothetical protein
MRFSIGGIFAKCGACKCNDFYPALPLTSDTRDVFICVACGSQSVYSELVGQIAKRSGAPAGVTATNKVAEKAVTMTVSTAVRAGICSCAKVQ